MTDRQTYRQTENETEETGGHRAVIAPPLSATPLFTFTVPINFCLRALYIRSRQSKSKLRYRNYCRTCDSF